MLIDSTASTDYIGRVRALASNSAMAYVATLMVPLGLIVMIYWLTGLDRLIVLVEDDLAAAVSRFGTLSVTMGGFGWIIADGLIHILAETRIQSEQALQAAVPIAQAEAGIGFISSIALLVGCHGAESGLVGQRPGGLQQCRRPGDLRGPPFRWSHSSSARPVPTRTWSPWPGSATSPGWSGASPLA